MHSNCQAFVGLCAGGCRSEPRGMRNPGGLCYRNAVFTMLFCNDRFMTFLRHRWLPLRKEILGNKADRSTPSSFRLLGQFWDAFWDDNKDDGVCDDILDHEWIRTWKLETGDRPWFPAYGDKTWGRLSAAGREKRAINMQRDAAEFLDHLINAEKSPFLGMDSLGESVGNALDADLGVLSGLYTAESRLCTGCEVRDPAAPAKRFRMRKEIPDIQWRLDLPPNHGYSFTLMDVLRRYFKDRTDGYLCHVCYAHFTDPAEREALRNSTRGVIWRKIRRLPEILFMQLKRFNGVDGISSNTLRVELPEELDLAEFFDQSSRMPDWERVNSTYELVGIVAHRGSLNTGHYINWVKVDGQWWLMNDQSCQRSTFDSADRGIDDDPDYPFLPYILAWQRRVDISLDDVEKLKAAGEQAMSTGEANVSPGARQSSSPHLCLQAEAQATPTARTASRKSSSARKSLSTGKSPRASLTAVTQQTAPVPANEPTVTVVQSTSPQAQKQTSATSATAPGEQTMQTPSTSPGPKADLDGIEEQLPANPSSTASTEPRAVDDADSLPSLTRKKIREAVQQTLNDWNLMWKHWKQPVQVVNSA